MNRKPTFKTRLRRFISTHPYIAQMSFGASLVAFTFTVVMKLAEDILRNEVVSFDGHIVPSVYSLRSDALTAIMYTITAVGSPRAVFILCILVVAYLYHKKQKEAILFSLIFLSAAVLNLLLKVFFARPRPTLMPLAIENSYSFPSGHAMNSLVFFMMMSYFLYRNTKNVRLTLVASVVSAFLVGLIGFSRIYLGVHYPSDVIAGYATGTLWCTSIIMIEKFIHARRSATATRQK